MGLRPGQSKAGAGRERSGCAGCYHQRIMVRIRLIASDLDGTLLGPDERVSERTRLALRAAREAGIGLVLVTGRPPRWVHETAEQLELELPVICANGAIVYDAARRRLLAHRAMSSETARAVVLGLRERVSEPRFAFEMGLAFGREPAYQPFASRPAARNMVVGDAIDLIRQPVTKILVRHARLDAAALAEALEPSDLARIEATWSTPGLLEISAAGVTKASALAELCAGLGIRAESVAAFGDMPNDLSMLLWAGLGLAMGNAHPTLHAGCDRQIETNAEDGVAREIERWLAPR